MRKERSRTFGTCRRCEACGGGGSHGNHARCVPGFFFSESFFRRLVLFVESVICLLGTYGATSGLDSA